MGNERFTLKYESARLNEAGGHDRIHERTRMTAEEVEARRIQVVTLGLAKPGTVEVVGDE